MTKNNIKMFQKTAKCCYRVMMRGQGKGIAKISSPAHSIITLVF